jgi:hypothetical protein
MSNIEHYINFIVIFNVVFSMQCQKIVRFTNQFLYLFIKIILKLRLIKNKFINELFT